MEIRFPSAEVIFLTSSDHKRIQVYWLPCRTDPDKGQSDIGGGSHPTMILCGPNGQYAEQLQYNTDLLDFYLDNGINVVAYNYRGYGLSEGTPSVDKLRTDAETVALYVR